MQMRLIFLDLNDSRALALNGDTIVNFADVAGGDVRMTVIFMLGGGCHSCVEFAFMGFPNGHRLYPIQGAPDNVSGACYRSGPKGWMYLRVFTEWLSKNLS